MLFAMSEIAPKGSSRRVNRRQGLSRYTVDASLNSRGIGANDRDADERRARGVTLPAEFVGEHP